MAIFLSRIKRALNVGSKSITNNGTYYASADGYDGYDEVTVNVSGGSATPITPSNANPVALTSGVAVEPTANGYAIQSYDNITPPSSPQAISSGDILKMIGNGYVIDTYSTATPSDSTPPQLSQGYLYEPTANGYLYESSGLGKCAVGTCTNSSSSADNISVVLGFEPKYLCVSYFNNNVMVYDERHSTTKYYRCSSTPTFDGQASLAPSSTGNTIQRINNDGFTIRSSGNRTWNYFAIG